MSLRIPKDHPLNISAHAHTHTWILVSCRKALSLRWGSFTKFGFRITSNIRPWDLKFVRDFMRNVLLRKQLHWKGKKVIFSTQQNTAIAPHIHENRLLFQVFWWLETIHRRGINWWEIKRCFSSPLFPSSQPRLKGEAFNEEVVFTKESVILQGQHDSWPLLHFWQLSTSEAQNERLRNPIVPFDKVS